MPPRVVVGESVDTKLRPSDPQQRGELWECHPLKSRSSDYQYGWNRGILRSRNVPGIYSRKALWGREAMKSQQEPQDKELSRTFILQVMKNKDLGTLTANSEFQTAIVSIMKKARATVWGHASESLNLMGTDMGYTLRLQLQNVSLSDGNGKLQWNIWLFSLPDIKARLFWGSQMFSSSSKGPGRHNRYDLCQIQA